MHLQHSLIHPNFCVRNPFLSTFSIYFCSGKKKKQEQQQQQKNTQVEYDIYHFQEQYM